ncbi:serine/threonine-protein kinase [Streptomyces sp. NPDC090106]|uniref:serine/threonine-protein kinase n=1 Tax=Streptomyces sp. NPDC090106 TaxID=3365946 RepID=UPI00381C19D4
MNNATEVFQPLQADDPPQVAGYRLAARLGAGGMGRVYLSHTQGGRPVAIKVVRPELADDPAFRRRFGREIKAARRVRGAYTAELIDADADGAPPWLATLYVPGPSLSDAVARRGPLPAQAVLWLTAGVAEALQAIHDAGIVHRDLKPSNVLLAADGPRVIDFGISLAADATSHTATGGTIGTPAFMAPEQASGGEVTAASDVFALGQTAAFAALGEPLYGDGPAVNLLYRIVHERPDLSLLPERLRPLFARCMAAEPAERATPAEVLAWCREQLGADTGAGATVWREITGPEPVVPEPVATPVPVHTVPPPVPVHTMPTQVQVHTPPPAGFGPPPLTLPAARSARRRRTVLLTVAAVATGALLLSGAVWRFMDAKDRRQERETTASVTPGGRTSAPATETGDGTGDARDAVTGDDGAAAASRPAASPSSSLKAFPLAAQRLDQQNSLDLVTPDVRDDRKGDIRFGCTGEGCSLKSDRTAMVVMYGEPGVTYDECSLMAEAATSHSIPLAAVAAGTEICVRHESGAVALLVVTVKSDSLPDSGWSFLMADVTVWRQAQT